MVRSFRLLAALAAAALVPTLAASCSSSPSTSPPAAQATSPANGSTGRSATTTEGSGGAQRSERSTTTTSSGDDTEDTDDTAGGSSGTSSVAAACDLLREEDVVDAFGEPVEAGTQDSSECWWATKNDLKNVNLQIDTDADLETWRSGYQNSSWEPVDLGDEGYAGKVIDSIVFRVGDTTYELTVTYSTKGDAEAAVKALADRAASRV